MGELFSFPEKDDVLVDMETFRRRQRKISAANYHPVIEAPKLKPTTRQKFVAGFKRAIHLDGMDIDLSSYGNAPAGQMNEISHLPIRPQLTEPEALLAEQVEVIEQPPEAE